MAATMIALYKTPPDQEKFDTHYFGTHLPLVQKIPGLVKVEVCRFTGKEAPYYLMATLYFNSREERKMGLNSPEGKATSVDLPNFAESGQFTIAFADIV